MILRVYARLASLLIGARVDVRVAPPRRGAACAAGGCRSPARRGVHRAALASWIA